MKQPEGKYVLIKDPNKVSCFPYARLGSAACITSLAATSSLGFVASWRTGFPSLWKPMSIVGCYPTRF